MPQATFHYVEEHADVETINAMANDISKVANYIGTPIPEEATFLQYLPGGNALHLHGCNRIGDSPDDSVADRNCKAWGVNNLYVGGSGVIPKGIGCNPTLTAVAFALRASMDILGLDTSDTFHAPVEGRSGCE